MGEGLAEKTLQDFYFIVHYAQGTFRNGLPERHFLELEVYSLCIVGWIIGVKNERRHLRLLQWQL